MPPDRTIETTHHDHVRSSPPWWVIPPSTRDVVLPLALILIALIGLCGLTGMGGGLFGGAPDGAVGGAAVIATPACRPLPTTDVAAIDQLRVGGQAVVCDTMGVPLRLQCSPGMQQKEVGRIPEGTVVDVLEGPTPFEGFRWWRISSPEGAMGWAPANWLCPVP